MAAGREDRGARLADRGVASLSIREGLGALERLLEQDLAQVVVTHFDRRAFVDAYPAAATSSMLPLDSAQTAESGGHRTAAPPRRDAVRELPPGRRRLDAVERCVADAVSRVLREASSSIDRDKPLRSLGLDSLMGLELRNRLEAESGLVLPATVIWNHPTVRRLAAHLLERLQATIPGVPDAPVRPSPTEAVSSAPPAGEFGAGDDATLAALLDEIESMTPEEARRLLSAEGGGDGG